MWLEWKLIFSSLVANFWVFQIFWHIECSTFTAPSSRIWNSSTGIPSPPLVLFIVMLPKDDLTLQSRISGLGEWLPIFLLLGANQNHKEVSSDTGQNGQHQNVYNKKMLARVCGKENPCTMFLGMETGARTMEIVWRFLKKVTTELSYDLTIPLLWYISRKN